MKIGSKVRLVQPVIEGPVVKKDYDADTDSLKYLVEYKVADGEVHTRWFTEAELEVIEE